MIGLLRWLRASRFERAYILLYNNRIEADQFHIKAGISNKREAWRKLTEYRRRVIAGEIPDPRDTYRKWT